MKNQKIEDLRELARRAHSGTSFDQEKRADSFVKSYSQELNEDIELIKKHDGDVVRYETKYIKLLTEWQSAKGRCMSSMITGPANFPVERNRRNQNAEMNKYEVFSKWREKALHAITKPENTDIVKGSDGALEKMISKLETLEAYQEQIKFINKTLRSKKHSEVEKIDIIRAEYPERTEEQVIELMTPDCHNQIGFAGYSLTNNGAKIRSLKKDIEGEKIRQDKYKDGNKEHEIKGVKVIENVEQNRIQLVFDGKPEQDIITLLKKRGFRWSPRNTAWQRQLTANGIYAAKQILREIKNQ